LGNKFVTLGNNILHMLQQNTRRNFLVNTTKTAAALALGNAFLNSCTSTKKGTIVKSIFNINYTQAPLPYAFNALEPAIDAATMEIHHTKHAATYLKNTQDAFAELKVQANALPPIEFVLQNISKQSTKMRNNAGGHFNHEFFWQSLRAPLTNNQPSSAFIKIIETTFTSLTDFKQQITDAAKNRFGSGWVWLYINNKQLLINSTPNQDNPLMDVAEIKGKPILALDVWEHAYYLKYQNKRADYVNNWFNIINWPLVEARYNKVIGS
jgi:superoxide dismutase, Fe-Mn family